METSASSLAKCITKQKSLNRQLSEAQKENYNEAIIIEIKAEISALDKKIFRMRKALKLK
jgi:hypothetical protein